MHRTAAQQTFGKNQPESTSTESTPPRRPYRLEPVALGRPARGIDLDKALQLADNLEDQELARKLELRK